mmetsp:Transcript_101362/g.194345  ORF Transcript_101362/g.194345 Transcript_101362/m.194345 type:complete len:248 (-) Transcript_101362:1039-1782(-)
MLTWSSLQLRREVLHGRNQRFSLVAAVDVPVREPIREVALLPRKAAARAAHETHHLSSGSSGCNPSQEAESSSSRSQTRRLPPQRYKAPSAGRRLGRKWLPSARFAASRWSGRWLPPRYRVDSAERKQEERWMSDARPRKVDARRLWRHRQTLFLTLWMPMAMTPSADVSFPELSERGSSVRALQRGGNSSMARNGTSPRATAAMQSRRRAKRSDSFSCGRHGRRLLRRLRREVIYRHHLRCLVRRT